MKQSLEGGAREKRVTKPPVKRALLDAMGTEEFLRRVMSGQSYSHICRELGVAMATLVDWIAMDSDRSARAKQARIISAETFADRAGEKLDSAADPFELAKAKEQAHHLRWLAKTRDPGQFGDKQQIGGANDLPPVGVSVAMTPSQAYLAMLGKR